MLTIALISLYATNIVAPQSPDPKTLIQQAVQATSKIKNVFYNVRGYMDEVSPSGLVCEGWTVMKLRDNNRANYPYTRSKFIFTIPADGSRVNAECSYTSEGSVAFNDRTRRVGIGNPGATYYDYEPYLVFIQIMRDGEIDADDKATLSYEGKTRIGAEECHKVRQTFKGGSILWSISAQDSIPRAWEAYKANGKLSRIFQVTDMKVNDPSNEAKFKIEAPKGYIIDKEFSLPRLEYAKGGQNYKPEFLYSSPSDPYLVKLREAYKLDDLVKYYPDDLNKVRVMCNWVHSRWQHDSNNKPEKPDPITILKEAEKGARFRCVEYSIVLSGCLNAVGIPTRIVGLMSPDIEISMGGKGHIVVEAYIASRKKWVMADGQNNAVPIYNGQPLNAVEFQRELSKGAIFSVNAQGDVHGYPLWASRLLFYYRIPLDQRFGIDQRATGQVGLRPVDAPAPTVFERVFKINDTTYVNDPSVIYQPPAVGK